MKVLHDEGLVNHVGPESCVVSREGAIEALTGDVWAELLSREKDEIRVLTLSPGWKAILTETQTTSLSKPCAVPGARHAHKFSVREPRDPDIDQTQMRVWSAWRTSPRERPRCTISGSQTNQ